MFDKIEKKVKEIHKQPEHIRMRYMWLSLSIAMTFVVIIWLMSIRINFNKARMDEKSQSSVQNIQTQIQKIDQDLSSQKNAVSIDDLLTGNSTTPR